MPTPRSGLLRSGLRTVRLAALTCLVAAGAVATSSFADMLTTPSIDAMETTKLVARVLPQQHLNRPVLDDAYSQKFLKTYLDTLDPLKRYFTRDDIAEFQQYRTVLDDNLLSGNPEFGLKAYARWKQRHAERTAYAIALLDREFDFSKDESFVVDADLLDWGTPSELDDRWRKYVKEQLLEAKLDDRDLAAERERLKRRYRNQGRLIQQKTAGEALETFLTASGQVFDPHSTYMTAKTYKEFSDMMRLQLEGIGAALRGKDGFTKVVEVVEDGAAYRDGRLKEGDVILAVGSSADDLEDIVELNLNDVVKKIRGPKGSTVWLQVRPGDGGDLKLIDIVREKIEMKDARVKGEIIDLQSRIGRPGRIGVISLPSFYRDFDSANAGARNFTSAAADIRKVLNDFRNNGPVDAVIVDVRNNGGGSLDEAIEISGLFIDEGPIVQVRDLAKGLEVRSDTDRGFDASPLIVATNRYSASASEIFAGAIKDYNRGIVVGDRSTHGKGTVQSLAPLDRMNMARLFGGGTDKGYLKLTIQQFYRVNGDSTQTRGVPSDIELPSLRDWYDLGEEFLENALPFDQIKNADFRPLRMVTPGVISQLAAMSRGRIKADEEFAEIQEDIDRYLEVKNRTTLSLNETERRIEKEKYSSEDDEEKEAELEAKMKRDRDKVLPESPANEELLQIAADYVRILRQSSAAAQR